MKKDNPIALPGNSGNHHMPLPHFQICERPDFFFSIAVPFVQEKITITGVAGIHLTSVRYTNCMCPTCGT